MKRLLATAAAAAFLFMGSALAAAPTAPIVLKSAKQGDVTFKHQLHKELKCTTCHESDKGGKMVMDMKKGHATCQKCHMEKAKEDPSKAALKACTTCHKKK